MRIECISLLVSVLLSVYSCDSGDASTQEQEAMRLEQVFAEIQDLVASVKCEDAEGWVFTSYGSKACGGPVGYLAYSSSIDVQLLLQKVEEHRQGQKVFNEKWGVISDCSIPEEPYDVQCIDGLAVLLYP